MVFALTGIVLLLNIAIMKKNLLAGKKSPPNARWSYWTVSFEPAPG